MWIAPGGSLALVGLALVGVVGSAAASVVGSAAGSASESAAGGVPVGVPGPAGRSPNILLLIADDLGNDYVGVYGEGPPSRQPPTPNLDRLARSGVWFRNAYTNPICSPSRALLYTGRYGFRTGVGANINHPDQLGLPPGEVTLAEVLGSAGYSCALLGKWHLGWPDATNLLVPPIEQGWQRFAGTVHVITDYERYEWRRATELRTFPDVIETAYPPTLMTDLAIQWIANLPEPWFLTLAYHSPHRPYHDPPTHLHHYGGVLDPDLQFQAMVEALDTEIGRLLFDPVVDFRDTTVFFVGDNGTEADRVFFKRGDYPSAKGSLYEAGINVPLIVAGAGVKRAGGESAALVDGTDLFATVIELAGVGRESVPADSVSFADVLADPTALGGRNWVYTEVFTGPGAERTRDHQSVRGPRYKLLLFHGVDGATGSFEFHDLQHADQENLRTTLLCRDFDTPDGWDRGRAQLDPEQRRELRRLRRTLDDLGAWPR